MEDMYERWFNLLDKVEADIKELREEVSGAYQEFKHNEEQSNKE